MIIKWFGNSCFSLQDSLGHKILINPLDNITSSKVNIITFSQKPLNYFSYPYLKNKNILIDCIGLFKYNFVTIKGYNSYTDNIKGLKRGENIFFTYNIDNLILCHLGHLGHIIDNDLILSIGKIDILFVPIEGNITLNYLDSTKLIEKLSPKIIIPMCYKSSYNEPYKNTLKDFLYFNKSKPKFYVNTLDTEDILDSSYSNIVILKRHKYIDI